MPAERQTDGDAPGAPGIEPRWTSSAKTGVGTAAQSASQVWFTVSHGILDEIYWPEQADGSWPQTMWVRGAGYWHGEQMDQCAFPVLLTAKALREKLIDQAEATRLWPMVSKALSFIVQRGLESWRFSDKIQSLSKGKNLRIEVLAPACVRWSIDGWKTSRDSETKDSKFGIHFVDLPATELATDTGLNFTFRWAESGNWEGKNFTISL